MKGTVSFAWLSILGKEETIRVENKFTMYVCMLSRRTIGVKRSVSYLLMVIF